VLARLRASAFVIAFAKAMTCVGVPCSTAIPGPLVRLSFRLYPRIGGVGMCADGWQGFCEG